MWAVKCSCFVSDGKQHIGFYGYIYYDDMKLLHEMQKGWLAETGTRLQRLNENKQGV